MKSIPEAVTTFKRINLFTESTVPAALLAQHRTAAGVWGRITVERGEILYTITGGPSFVLTPQRPGVIEPQVEHFLTTIGDVAFFVEFLKDQN